MEFSLVSIFFLSVLVLKLLAGFTMRKKSKAHGGSGPSPGPEHKLPPGPKPWPIVGNLPEMLAQKSVSKWIHKMMRERGTEIACIKLGSVHVISVTNPTIAREFFKKQDSVFASRPEIMSSEIISGGYLTTVAVPFGDQWKKMRKIISNDLLSKTKHQWMHGKRTMEADNLVRFVYNQCSRGINGITNGLNKEGEMNDDGGVVNVRIAARNYCGNVFRRLLFNKRYFGDQGRRSDGGSGFEEEEHVDAIFTALSHQFAFCVSDFLPYLRCLDLQGHEAIIKKAIATLNKYHDPIIDDRIQQWKNGTRKVEDDWLDVLISLKDAHNKPLLTKQEIKSQIMEILLAGLDNPSNAIEWGLAEMINHPHILQKAQKELDDVVGKLRLVQESDFINLNYVKACARETFRLHPIVGFIVPHVSLQDTVVSNYFIPKGSHVLVSRPELGRHPTVWADPLKFKPERHLSRKEHNYSGSDLREPGLDLVTFGTGKRGCPAFLLGTTMVMTLFARLVHAFDWSVPRGGRERIDVSECEDSMFLANPLVALAKPRLAREVYHKLID